MFVKSTTDITTVIQNFKLELKVPIDGVIDMCDWSYDQFFFCFRSCQPWIYRVVFFLTLLHLRSVLMFLDVK